MRHDQTDDVVLSNDVLFQLEGSDRLLSLDLLSIFIHELRAALFLADSNILNRFDGRENTESANKSRISAAVPL